MHIIRISFAQRTFRVAIRSQKAMTAIVLENVYICGDDTASIFAVHSLQLPTGHAEHVPGT